MDQGVRKIAFRRREGALDDNDQADEAGTLLGGTFVPGRLQRDAGVTRPTDGK